MSQIGFATLLSEAIKKLYANQPLSEEELALIDGQPVVAYRLISKIPRLENVASMMLRHRGSARTNSKTSDKKNESTDSDTDSADETITTGALMLQFASEYDEHIGREMKRSQAIALMRETIDSKLMPFLESLSKLRLSNDSEAAVFKMASVEVLSRGMVLDQEISDCKGPLLMASGQLVTDTVIHCSSIFVRRGTLFQTIRVRVAA